MKIYEWVERFRGGRMSGGGGGGDVHSGRPSTLAHVDFKEQIISISRTTEESALMKLYPKLKLLRKEEL
jgi:hypothetical protein